MVVEILDVVMHLMRVNYPAIPIVGITVIFEIIIITVHTNITPHCRLKQKDRLTCHRADFGLQNFSMIFLRY